MVHIFDLPSKVRCWKREVQFSLVMKDFLETQSTTHQSLFVASSNRTEAAVNKPASMFGNFSLTHHEFPKNLFNGDAVDFQPQTSTRCTGMTTCINRAEISALDQTASNSVGIKASVRTVCSVWLQTRSPVYVELQHQTSATQFFCYHSRILSVVSASKYGQSVSKKLKPLDVLGRPLDDVHPCLWHEKLMF